MALLPRKRDASDRPLASLQREMNRLFDSFFEHDLFVEPFRGPGTWAPALDVSETDHAVMVKVELPGMEEKDIEVSLTGNVLTVRGEKKEEKEQSTRSYFRMERSYGSFERSIQLPVAVKGDQVNATFKSGVLNIELPKAEEMKSRSVQVKAG